MYTYVCMYVFMYMYVCIYVAWGDGNQTITNTNN